MYFSWYQVTVQAQERTKWKRTIASMGHSQLYTTVGSAMSSAVSKLRSVKLHILSKYDFVHNPPWCNDDQIVHFLRETCSECWLILNSGKPQRKNQWTRGLQEHGPFHEEKVPTALNVANASSTGTDLWHSRKKNIWSENALNHVIYEQFIPSNQRTG